MKRNQIKPKKLHCHILHAKYSKNISIVTSYDAGMKQNNKIELIYSIIIESIIY